MVQVESKEASVAAERLVLPGRLEQLVHLEELECKVLVGFLEQQER